MASLWSANLRRPPSLTPRIVCFLGGPPLTARTAREAEEEVMRGDLKGG